MGRAPRTVPKSSPYRIAWSSAPAPDCRSTDEVAPLDVLPKTFPAVVATSAAVVKVSTRRKRAASRLSGPPSTSASYVARNRTGILLRDIGLAQTRVGEPRKNARRPRLRTVGPWSYWEPRERAASDGDEPPARHRAENGGVVDFEAPAPRGLAITFCSNLGRGSCHLYR